ncbi:abortive infection system antitoxin AbiGi family protein [Vibrio metschnikovii]|uniref:abortive infection system antitoxin AbiGi family protein n=1 Tax=Vibrio metschnikovii TaxID=28172 RepID=UPI001C310A8A|nr:abortive infection system antitoxin AbiGi family protein [Vibrio metschnikovii]MDA3140303.1 hypothetical protein [Vibrio metschnikovii]
MKPKSHTLFHFTKNKEVLKNILKEGFWPRYCLEDLRWYNLEETPFVGFPIVCFCDIPLSRINEHVEFYGEYGIGVTKEWAIRSGLNPVMYVSSESGVASSLIRQSYINETDEDDLDFINIMSHTKPIEGQMMIQGQIVQKDFYQENEWRYLARCDKFKPFLLMDRFEDQEVLREANVISKEHCSLKLQPSDIKYLFVKNDASIPDIINFIQTDLDNYSGADQKILMSRVISLESVRADL